MSRAMTYQHSAFATSIRAVWSRSMMFA
jgi:hypothetical protein